MLSLNYLKYLFNSKKYLLLFITTLTIFSIVSVKESTASVFVFSLACALTYIIPLDVFSYIHNNKAVDSYYSLPLKRKELLFTGLLFSMLVIGSLFIFGYSLIEILDASFSTRTFIDLLVVLLGLAVLISFNTLLYQIGNSVLDGVVMIFSYSFLPFAMYLVINFFYEQFVYGFEIISTDFETFFSPLYMHIVNFINIRTNNNYYRYGYLIAMAIILVLSIIALNYLFENRNVERANSASKSFFAYPFIINLYALLCLLSLAFNYNVSYNNFLEYLIDNSILIIIVFMLYVITHFIYKRSFYFDYKLPLVFILLFVLCLGFSEVARVTEGFGLAYTYNKENINRCEIYISNPSESLRKELKMDDEYLFIEIDMGKTYDEVLDDEMLKLIEEKRLKAIDDYYDGKNFEYSATINIYNNYYVNKYGLSEYDDHYYYGIDNDFNLNDLMEFAKDEKTDVLVQGDTFYGKLDESGKLIDFETNEEIALN